MTGILILLLAVPAGSIANAIDPTGEPLQTAPAHLKPLLTNLDQGAFTITPVADYQIAALVAAKRNYYNGWAGQLVPFDLVMAWGRLAEPAEDRYLDYIQLNRWYFYGIRPGSTLTQAYVATHSANHHLIPANQKIREGLELVKPHQLLVLTGCLVNLKGTYDNQIYWWNTSLTRQDTGSGSCELFYVTSVRLGELIYE